MPKSRPALFDFLDSLTNHLRYIGRDQLALDIKAGYARGTGGVDSEWIISKLADELELSKQLELPFAA